MLSAFWRRERLAPAVLAALSLLTPGWARAQPSPADRALATDLFNQGRELLATGKTAQACEKLAESQRLDPGGGTALNLGLCYEKLGRLASAWTVLSEALGMARRDRNPEREAATLERIASVEPRLSHLVIEVPVASDLPGLKIQRDGSEVGRAAWGTSMPVDGGVHRVDVRADGYEPWAVLVEVAAESDSKTVEVPSLHRRPVRVAPAHASPAHRVAEPTRRHEGVNPDQLQRLLGLGLGASGLLAIGIGSYFGVQAVREQKDSNAECPHGCTVDGAALSRSAANHADIATAGFSVGFVGLGVGTYLVLSSGSPASPSKTGLRISPGALSFSGAF